MVEVADRFDRLVRLVVDLVEHPPGLAGQAHVHGLELAEGALLAVAIAEVDPAVGNRGLAADGHASGPGKALLGGFHEGIPGEAEDRRRSHKAKSRESIGCPAGWMRTLSPPALGARQKKSLEFYRSACMRRTKFVNVAAGELACLRAQRTGERQQSVSLASNRRTFGRLRARRSRGERGRARCRSKQPTPSRNQSGDSGS
jgi:hypothetical protein